MSELWTQQVDLRVVLQDLIHFIPSTAKNTYCQVKYIVFTLTCAMHITITTYVIYQYFNSQIVFIWLK